MIEVFGVTLHSGVGLQFAPHSCGPANIVRSASGTLRWQDVRASNSRCGSNYSLPEYLRFVIRFNSETSLCMQWPESLLQEAEVILCQPPIVAVAERK